MSDYGVKFTKDGADVTSTNVADYIVYSKYQIPKTYIVGTSVISLSTELDTQSNHTNTISHNLGYTPVCTFFWNTGGQTSGGFWSHGIAGGHNTFSFLSFHVDNSNLYMQYTYDNIGGGDGKTLLAPITFDMKYYIFIDQGA